MCKALLSRRSPPRLNQRRSTLPDKAVIGLTPDRATKAASERARPGCDHKVYTNAAIGGPTPSTSSSGAARPASNNSVTLSWLSLISPLRTCIRFASRTASARAITRSIFTLRSPHEETLSTCASVSDLHASTPKATIRKRVVRALIFDVRRNVICSRTAVRTRNTARIPSACRGIRNSFSSKGKVAAAISAASIGSVFPELRRVGAYLRGASTTRKPLLETAPATKAPYLPTPSMAQST